MKKNKNKISINYKKYKEENQIKVLKSKKDYYIKNKDKILKKNSEYCQQNKDKISIKKQEYRIKNKDKIRKNNLIYIKNRLKTDNILKLKRNVSRAVNTGLQNRNSSKAGKSFFKISDFTAQQLMDHLMNHSQKKWWMNEGNQGKYNINTWDDNDPSTWVWNIDHIIPHSEFNYTSMSDPEFKKCWSLKNLRPYSAKQNLLDGNRR